MNKLLAFVCATIGSAIGWWLGSLIGIMTAFVVSVLGTAVGVYVAGWIAREYL